MDISLYVDPYDGRIIEERAPQSSVMGWLADLHIDLLSGERGHFVVGVSGVLMMLLGLTGLWLWWPGARRWWRGFTIHRRSNWKGINYDLHRVGGALVSLGLVVIALCGVALVWSAPLTNLLNRIARTPTPLKIAVAPSRAPVRSLDELVARANEAFPDGEVRRISFPASRISFPAKAARRL